MTTDDAPAHGILTPEVLAFVGDLHRRFNPLRMTCLQAREDRQAALSGGALPDFVPEESRSPVPPSRR